MLKNESVIISCANLLQNRIRLFGVHKDYVGIGLGSHFLAQLKCEIPDCWMTVGLEHYKVIKVAIKSGFRPVNYKFKIRTLFQQNLEFNLNQMAFSCVVDEEINKVTEQNRLIAFSRLKGGIHALAYAQIVLT